MSGDSESFLFPESLVLCELLVPAEVAFECLVALGNLDAPVHIGSDGSRSTPIVVSSISGPSKHCRDLLMTLGSVRSHLTAYGEFIRLHCGSDWRPDESEIDSLAATLKPKMLFDLEASICSLHKDLTELAKLEADMNSEYVRLVHLVNILDCLDNVFWATNSRDATPRSVPAMADKEAAGILLHGGSSTELDTSAESTDRTLPFIVGVVPTSKAHCLRLGVWRRFHLTALYTDIPVRDQRDLRDEPVEPHNVFLIVSLSESQSRTAERLCGMLGAQVFSVPISQEDRRNHLMETKERLSEMRQVFLEGEEHRKRLALNGWTKWRRWFAQLTAMQAVHRALDGFSRGYGKQFYVGEVWCSREAVDSVRQALAVGSSRASGLHATVRLVENSRRRPPTRMPRHELTAAVRDLTYQFGVPAHWEIDPTPFTAVTFPFLFAIMFADWGHGLLLMALALALFLPPGRFLHPDVARSLAPLRPGRHLLLMCAVFAVYCGAVLNDGFGLTGGWRRHSQFSMGNLTYGTFVNQSISQLQLAPKEDGHVMSWVTDSMWGSAANQVKFLNSARMKLSIIFGTLHLGLGLALQLVNDIRAGRTARVWLFSSAKMAFHCLLMGYPVALILRKWLAVLPRDAACAPALLPMLIAMYRLEYTETPCYLATYYSGQRYVEHAIVAGVAASALLAIFGLPIHHALTSRGSSSSKAKAEQKLTAAATDVPGDREEEEIGKGKSDSAMPLTPLSSSSNSGSRGKSLPKLEPEPLDCAHGEKQFDLLEHCLACFEFLLSSLSHSASYLRLWAIGLAHGELTAIMWPMLLMPPTRLADLLAASPTAALLLGGLTLAASFCLWACITVCILVGMEGMTALLHSLRLHWIEFQSKFYSGAGYMFRPFSLKAEVRQAMDSCADFAASGEEFH